MSKKYRDRVAEFIKDVNIILTFFIIKILTFLIIDGQESYINERLLQKIANTR